MYYGGNPPAGDASRSDGGLPEFQSAVGMWSGIADTNINLIYGAGSTYAMDCGQGQPGAYDNYVMFNDPCNDIADLVNCTGILGFGGPWFGTPPNTTPDGTTWWTIISQFVVLNHGQLPEQQQLPEHGRPRVRPWSGVRAHHRPALADEPEL
jgi:hypothetical protein